MSAASLTPSPTASRAPLGAWAVRDAAAYAADWLAVQQRVLRIPGIQVAVLHEDTVLLDRAFGVADLRSQTPLTTRHLFRIASHSKMFTAIAVLQLVERHALRLDDRADCWLPHLRGVPLGAATVRDLLGHGAGVSRDSQDGDFWQLSIPFPDAASLRELTGQGADVLPVSERFKYSNLGYGLAGLVIEAASGLPYAAYVRAHIVEPLGLLDTGPEWDPAREPEYATGHTGTGTAVATGAERMAIPHVNTRALAPATGFFSTARDLVRFAAAQFTADERLLSDDSMRRMHRSEWPTGRTGEDYGLGTIVSHIGGRRTVGHSGGFPGYITRTILDPVDRFAICVLTNAIDGPASMLAAGVTRLVGLAAAEPAPSPARSAELDRFTGRFANLWGPLDVVRLGGGLYAIDPTAADPADQPVVLTPVDASTLRISGGTGYGSFGELFRYSWAPDGSVASVRADSGQTVLPADTFRAELAHQGDTFHPPLIR